MCGRMTWVKNGLHAALPFLNDVAELFHILLLRVLVANEVAVDLLEHRTEELLRLNSVEKDAVRLLQG